MAESNVAILPDSVLTGAHNVRTVTVYPSAPVSTSYGEEQQVITLAGTDGSMLNLENGAVPISSDQIVALLKAMILRLDLLNASLNRGYTPPDDLYR